MLKDEMALYELIHLSFFQKQRAIKTMVEELNLKSVTYLEPSVFRKYPVKDILMDHVHLTEKGGRLLAEQVGKKILELENN